MGVDTIVVSYVEEIKILKPTIFLIIIFLLSTTPFDWAAWQRLVLLQM